MKPRIVAIAQVFSTAILLVLSSTAHAQLDDSPHALQKANPPEIPIEEWVDDGQRLAGPPSARPERVVYGWFPSWVWKKKADGTWPPPPRIRWDLLTHISYFDVGISQTGALTGTSVLTQTPYVTLRDTAKQKGVKITITLTNFIQNGVDTISPLLQPAVRPTAIANIVEMVKDAGAEGVNIDFEFVQRDAKANFTAFMTELTAKMHAEVPGSHVTLAGPTVSYRANYDYDMLLEGSDGILPMFYGCHGQFGPNAGPAAPLSPGSTWSSTCNLEWVVGDYLEWGKVENRRKVFMGLPFYGNRWRTVDDSVPSACIKYVNEKGKEVCYHSAVTFAAGLTRMAMAPRWDSDSQTPWTTYLQDGLRHQLWTEDGESFDLKLAHLVAKDLGGIGIWALGYEGTSDELWDAIAKHFVPPAAPLNQAPVAVVQAQQSGRAETKLTLDGSASLDPEGAPLGYAWQQVEGPSVTLDANDAAIASFTPSQAGTYRFSLVVNDGQLSSAPAETTVTVAAKQMPPPTKPPEERADPTQPPATPPQSNPPTSVDGPSGCTCHGTASSGDAFLLFFTLMGALRRRKRSLRNPGTQEKEAQK